VKDDVDHVVLARSMSMPSFRACASSPRKRIASGEKPPQTSLMSTTTSTSCPPSSAAWYLLLSLNAPLLRPIARRLGAARCSGNSFYLPARPFSGIFPSDSERHVRCARGALCVYTDHTRAYR